MRLAPHEFIRRFLLHALPDGFHRIRHYGFLAKGERGQNLEHARALLYARSANQPTDDPTAPAGAEPEPATREAFALCPDCGGLMRRIGRIAASPAGLFQCDTS